MIRTLKTPGPPGSASIVVDADVVAGRNVVVAAEHIADDEHAQQEEEPYGADGRIDEHDGATLPPPLLSVK